MRCCPFLYALLLLSACSPYEVQFDGPYSDERYRFDRQRQIVWVEDSSLYFSFEDFTGKRLLASGGVSSVVVNDSFTRIAYKRSGEDIAVLDSSGALVETVANTANAVSFNWHNNNETLYLVEGNSLRFHGPDVGVAGGSLIQGLSGIAGSFSVLSAYVFANGTLVYSLRYRTTSGGPLVNGLVIAPAGGARVLYERPTALYRLRSNGDERENTLFVHDETAAYLLDISAPTSLRGIFNSPALAAAQPGGPLTLTYSRHSSPGIGYMTTNWPAENNSFYTYAFAATIQDLDW